MTNIGDTGTDFLFDPFDEIVLKIKEFFLRIKNKKVVRSNDGKSYQNR